MDYDHKEFLGDDLAVIAGEKAGVIKPGRPVVSARQAEVSDAAIAARARAVGAPLRRMGVDFDAWADRGRMLYQDETGLMDLPPPSLFGAHQMDNAGLAIAAAQALDDPRIDAAAVGRGVASASWPARMQRLTAGPYGEAARGAGGGPVAGWGAQPPRRARRGAGAGGWGPVALVAGTLANKDAAGFFAALAEPGVVSRVVAISFDAEAAAPAERTAAAARAGGAGGGNGRLHSRCGAARPGGPRRAAARPDLRLALPAGEVLAASEETWPT